MSYPISEIQEIGPAMAEKLKAQRIRTTAKLLERAKNLRGRQKLAAKIGGLLVGDLARFGKRRRRQHLQQAELAE